MDEIEESLQDSIAALEEVAAGVKPPEAWSQLSEVTTERFWQAWPNVRAWGEWLFTLIEKERGDKAEPVSPHDEHEEIGGG
jgi:hypothetical protein